MIKRIILSFTILLSISNFAIAQRLVKLNMLEKSPLSNMVVYSTNDSTARYTKLLAGTGIQINYNEGDTTLTIIATGTSVGVPQELSLNDATRELSITDGNTVDLSESIQDEVATLLQAGSNVTLTYDDGAGTLTIAATGGGGGATNLGDLGDVTITSATTGQVLKYDGAEWINAAESGGIALTDLSVTTNAAGSAALSYNNTNGVFSYTPPDLSSYLTSAQLANLTDIDTTGLANEYILKYNSSTQEWEVKVNDIDGLTDGYTQGTNNLILGREPAAGYNGVKSTIITTNGFSNVVNVDDYSAGMIVIGDNAYNTATKASAGNVVIGNNAMRLSNGSESTTAIGAEAGERANSSASVFLGTGAAKNLSAVSTLANTFLGVSTANNMTSGSRNTIIGAFAEGVNGDNQIVIGSGTSSSFPYYNYSKGPNSAKIGNTQTDSTFLHGNLNLEGYGLGNKDATTLGKTASAYIAGYATDGTLIELPSSGLGISLTDLSVTQNSPGTAGLTYNNTNGVFTYTPPDLSSYLTAEVDGSVTNEIQDLSITGNVLSLSGDATTVDLTESVQDEIAATVTAGDGITLTYDDALGTLTVAAPAGAGNTDEQTLSINNSTAELSISNGNTVDLSEAIDNQVNNLFVDGTNILSTYDDISNTLTVRTTDALTQIDAISFDNNVTDAVTSRLQYNADVGTFVAGMANNVPVKIGQDIGWYVKNNTASTIPKGTAVMAVGADGNSGIMLIDEMVFDGSADAKYFLGVTAEAITSTSSGFVISQGVLKGYDTSLIPAGTVLYGDPATPGGFTTTEPTGTNLKLPIANTLSQTNNGTIAIRVHTGLYMKDIHDVDITGVTNNSILKYNSTGGYWDIATDLVDDSDADPTNEIQDLSLSSNTLSLSGDATTVDLSTYLDDQTVTLTQGGIVSISGTYPNFTISATEVDGSVTNEIQDLSLTGNTLSLSGDATTVDLSPYLDEATTASNGLTLSGTDVKLGGTLSDATTTIDMNSNALTFTNNGGYNLSGTGGLSFTNTSATDYSSVLSIASTNTRIYADGGTTEPLNSLNLTSSRSGVKELDLRSSVSNDNTTYTMIALNPTRFSMKTPNVTDLTATNGQFLKLVDRLTGEVEFADALTTEVDGSVTNEIQDLSLTGNTLSLSSDATTVDLSPYLDDQTVTLTGGGITAISGTYPNFTITSTEVDGSATNEGQLSASTVISGTTARLTSNTGGGSNVDYVAGTGLAVGSSGGNTITYTNTLPEATTASNGLTETGNDIKLGGTLSGLTLIDVESNNFYIADDGATGTGIAILPALQEVNITGKISGNTELQMTAYGLGNKEASDLSLTGSAYLASFATDGTLIEYPISSISEESTTASNGLTLSGSDVKLGGNLTGNTLITTTLNNFSIGDLSTLTEFKVIPTSDLITMRGTIQGISYGSGNKEASDLSKTKSNYKAAFATDGTLIEVDDIDAMVIACSDETTDITTGTAKVTFRTPHAMIITGVRASLTTASSSGNPTIDINEGGTSILGTKLTIDANEKTSTTAVTAATITDTAIADDAEITIDIDAAGTGATGLKVTILYRKN